MWFHCWILEWIVINQDVILSDWRKEIVVFSSMVSFKDLKNNWRDIWPSELSNLIIKNKWLTEEILLFNNGNIFQNENDYSSKKRRKGFLVLWQYVCACVFLSRDLISNSILSFDDRFSSVVLIFIREREKKIEDIGFFVLFERERKSIGDDRR